MRLISANALIELANSRKDGTVDANDIARFPTIEAELVRHGKWIKVATSCGIDILECSECHKSHPQGGDDYCRDCGAKMDGGVAE